MNIGNITLDLEMEMAVRLLAEYLPSSEGRRKPILMHNLRVGFYLYERGSVREVVLGGLLHDVFEFSEMAVKLVDDTFGKEVQEIVSANTQDDSIEDKTKKWKDMVDRCVEAGEKACIVKTADVLDSLAFYRTAENASEIERSIKIGTYLLERLPDGMEDPIFARLKDQIE